MTHAVCKLAIFASLAACALPANGGPIGWPEGGSPEGSVFLQPPSQANGVASDTEHYFGGVPSWSNAADDVTLAQDATVVRLRWWSFYGDNFDPDPQPPSGDEVMRVRFYAPRPGDGLPGDILFEESFLNLPRISTGLQIAVGAAPDEYLFDAELSTPFEMTANTLYWLEIVQVGDLDSYHRWELANIPAGVVAFRSNFFPGWQYAANANWAFELLTIPEPTTIALLFLLPTLLFRGRGRYKIRNPR